MLNIYKKLITDFSKIILVFILILVSFFVYFSKDFKLDASSDALLLEGAGRVPMPPLPVIYTRTYTEAVFRMGEHITPPTGG